MDAAVTSNSQLFVCCLMELFPHLFVAWLLWAHQTKQFLYTRSSKVVVEEKWHDQTLRFSRGFRCLCPCISPSHQASVIVPGEHHAWPHSPYCLLSGPHGIHVVTHPSHFDAPLLSCLWGRTDTSVCCPVLIGQRARKGDCRLADMPGSSPRPLLSEPEWFTVLGHVIAVVTGENNSRLFLTTLPASSLSIQTNTPP